MATYASRSTKYASTATPGVMSGGGSPSSSGGSSGGGVGSSSFGGVISGSTPIVTPAAGSSTPTGTPGSGNFNPGSGATVKQIGDHTYTVGANNTVLNTASSAGSQYIGYGVSQTGPKTYTLTPPAAGSQPGVVQQEINRLSEKYPGYSPVIGGISSDNVGWGIIGYVTGTLPSDALTLKKYQYYTGPSPKEALERMKAEEVSKLVEARKEFPLLPWDKFTSDEGAVAARKWVESQGGVITGVGILGPGEQSAYTRASARTSYAKALGKYGFVLEETPFGGGMGGENIPGVDVIKYGASNLFARLGERDISSQTGKPSTRGTADFTVVGGNLKDVLEVKGGQEAVINAASGTQFTLIKPDVVAPSNESFMPSGWNNLYNNPVSQPSPFSQVDPDVMAIMPKSETLPVETPQGMRVSSSPFLINLASPLLQMPEEKETYTTVTESYVKPTSGGYAETGFIGGAFMFAGTGPLQYAAFKAGQYGINVGTALVGAASTIVGRVLKEGTEKYYTPVVDKIIGYTPESLKEPVAAGLLTAGPPGANVAFYYMDKLINTDKLTPTQRAVKVSGDVAEAVGIISTATFLGPKLIPQVGLETAANKLSLSVSKPYANVPEVEGGGFQVSIRKGGNPPNILYSTSKGNLNEPLVSEGINKPGLTERTTPMVEETYWSSAKSVEANTFKQKIPTEMTKPLDIASDVKSFKGEPGYTRVLSEELKSNKDLTGFGGVARTTQGASVETSDVDIFVTSRRSSTDVAKTLLEKFNAVKGSPVRISEQSPSLIEKQVEGGGYVHLVDIHGVDSPEIQSGIRLDKEFFPYGRPMSYESVRVDGINVRRLSVEGSALRGAATLPKVRGLTPYTPEETLLFETKIKPRYVEMGGTFEPVSHRIKDVGNFYDIQGRLIKAGEMEGSKSTVMDKSNLRRFKESAEYKFGKNVFKSSANVKDVYLFGDGSPSVKPYSIAPSIGYPKVVSSPSVASNIGYYPSVSIAPKSLSISYTPLSPSTTRPVSYSPPSPSTAQKSYSVYTPPSPSVSTSISIYTPPSPSPSISIYNPPYPSPPTSMSPYNMPYNYEIPGGIGPIWSVGGVSAGGRRRRGRSQRFVPAFVAEADVVLDMAGLGGGRSVRKSRHKTKRRKKK